jgi:signal peptidase II
MTQHYLPRFLQPYVTPQAALGLGLALSVLTVDQASKAWILYGINLPLLQQVKILPFFSLTMVWNDGISFGLLSAGDTMRWILAAFQLSVSCILIYWLRKAPNLKVALCLGLIIGGAIGNAIDRIRYGAVVDFIDVSGLYFPWVFNIADSAITIGVIFWLYELVIKGDVAQSDKGGESR